VCTCLPLLVSQIRTVVLSRLAVASQRPLGRYHYW